MGKGRIAVVTFASLAIAGGGSLAAVTAGSSSHRAVPASLVRAASSTPPAATALTPSATFDADAVLCLLTRTDAKTATAVIDALAPSDRAALTADIELRVANRPSPWRC